MKKDKKVEVRLTDDEMKKLNVLAVKIGASKSELIRFWLQQEFESTFGVKDLYSRK